MPANPTTNAAQLKLDRPAIFDSSIVAAVTQANWEFEPPHGFQARQREHLPEGMALQHRATLAATLNIDPAKLLLQGQVHADEIQVLRAESAPFSLQTSDGMISTVPNLALGVIIADCAAVLLHDPDSGAIGAVHSGWRGTQRGIVPKAIRVMQAEFGTEAAALRAYVSACASVQAYAVGPEVARQFPAQVVRESQGTLFLDIRARIIEQMQECGVHATHLEVSDACTITDKRYHSYRRDGQQAGRALAVIMRRT